MPSDEPLFTREEALGGLPARRAATLLFLIESRSAHFEAQSRLAAEEFPTEKASQELDLAFIEAFALSRKPPLRPTIQDLERHALKWAHLIPENARLKAAVAHLLSEKYSFSPQAIPGIRLALGLDDPAVQRAYQALYNRPLNTIFVQRVTLVERLRWVPTAVAKRLDSLPPFWTTFVLVITLSLPQAVLALPIATAGFGALAGVGLLIFFGVLNVVTMACMAEAFARNGSIHYGSAFTGGLVSDYVGKAGSWLLVSSTTLRLFIGLVSCYYGLSVTMASITAIVPSVWAAFLFLFASYLLVRKSLNFSTALSALLGAVSISLVLVILLVSVSHVHWPNLYSNVNLLSKPPFDRAIVQVIFGVVINSYIGHPYFTQCAKIVLPRDPGASSLLWGTVAASVAMTVLLCAWLLVVNGVVAPSLLTGQPGTALAPLALEIGPRVDIPAFFLVILLLGLAFIRQSIVLFNLARERIPIRLRSTVVLPRRRASLLLCKNGSPGKSPILRLTYLGLSERQSLFRLDVQVSGEVHRIELTIAKNWDVGALLQRLPELRPYSLSLELQIAEAGPESARLRVTSSMNLKYEGEWSSTELRSLKEPASESLTSPPALTHLGIHPMALWFRRAILNEVGRFVLSMSLIIAVFALTEWLIFTGKSSFTDVIAFGGLVGNSLVGGVFPVLLLVSSRRKGDLVPNVVINILGHPLVVISIYFLFVGMLFLHAILIWVSPVPRVAAFLVGVFVVAVTIAMTRQGAFSRRVIVEIKEDARRQDRRSATFRIAACGQPAVTEVEMSYAGREEKRRAAAGEVPAFGDLRSITFHLPATQARELKVWAHTVTPDGSSASMPANVELEYGGNIQRFDLKISDGAIVVPFNGDACRVQISFAEAMPV